MLLFVDVKPEALHIALCAGLKPLTLHCCCPQIFILHCGCLRFILQCGCLQLLCRARSNNNVIVTGYNACKHPSRLSNTGTLKCIIIMCIGQRLMHNIYTFQCGFETLMSLTLLTPVYGGTLNLDSLKCGLRNYPDKLNRSRVHAHIKLYISTP